MNVSFHGSVREFTNGEKSYDYPDPADRLSVRDLIGMLGSRFGERFREFLLGNETCLILINGRSLAMAGGLDAELKAGDKIDVLPFIEGG